MRYGELLMKTFGLSHVGVRTFAGLGPQQSLGLPENLALASTPALAGAPEIAAFFCALGRNYSEAQNVFQDYAAELQPTVSAINYGKPEDGRWTVSSARTALVLLSESVGVGKIKSALRNRHRLYWFLRLFDKAWLEEKVGEMRMHHVPTVEDDRVEICAYQDFAMAQVRVATPLRAKHCFTRASLRDREWFDALRAASGDLRADSLEMKTIETQSQRAMMISQTIAAAMKSKQRPIRMTIRSVAVLSGLSISQVEAAINAHPGVAYEIDQSNESFLERRLVWAARELMTNQRTVTPSAMCVRAGFHVNKPGIKGIAELVQANLHVWLGPDPTGV